MTLPAFLSPGGASGWPLTLANDLTLGHTDAVAGLQHKNPIIAAEYGIVPDGGDHGAALNTLIAQVSTAGGGSIILPAGNIYTSVPIDLRSFVHLHGVSWYGSQLRLWPGSTCDVIQFHQSTNGTTDSNAFYCGIWNLAIHGEGFNGSRTAYADYSHGINCTTNPVNTAASADIEFDPTHIICNVYMKACTGNGYYHLGRSGVRLIGVYSGWNNGNGFYPSYDTEMIGCHAGFNGLNGFYSWHSSNRYTGCKSYNNGNNTIWTSGQNWALCAGALYNNDGNYYVAKAALTSDTVAPPSDATNWDVVDSGYPDGGQAGFVVDYTGDAETAFSSCDAQQNAGSGFYLHNCSGVTVQGTVHQINTVNGGGTNASTNTFHKAAVVLDGAKGNNINVVTGDLGPAGNVLRSINSSTRNNVTLGSDLTEAAELTTDSTAIAGSGNWVLFNGTATS